MFADVALGGGAGIRPQQVAEPVERTQRVERQGAGLAGAGEGGRGVGVEDEERDDGGEVGRLPIAVDVRFGEADIAGEGAFGEKVFATNAQVRGGRNREREGASGGVGLRTDFVDVTVG